MIEPPNGDWISPEAVAGVRVLAGDTLGPRVAIDTHRHHAHHPIEFDNPETARAWAAGFARKCAPRRSTQPP